MVGENPQQILTSAAAMAAATCAYHGGFGHPAPLEVDQSLAKPLSQIYRGEETEETTRA